MEFKNLQNEIHIWAVDLDHVKIPGNEAEQRLPDEFQEVDLKVTVRRINKKTDRFAKLFLNPIKVEKIEIPTKNNIHER